MQGVEKIAGKELRGGGGRGEDEWVGCYWQEEQGEEEEEERMSGWAAIGRRSRFPISCPLIDS